MSSPGRCSSTSPTVADDWYVDLAEDVIARLPVPSFTLPGSEVLDWLRVPLWPRADEVVAWAAGPAARR